MLPRMRSPRQPLAARTVIVSHQSKTSEATNILNHDLSSFQRPVVNNVNDNTDSLATRPDDHRDDAPLAICYRSIFESAVDDQVQLFVAKILRDHEHHAIASLKLVLNRSNANVNILRLWESCVLSGKTEAELADSSDQDLLQMVRDDAVYSNVPMNSLLVPSAPEENASLIDASVIGSIVSSVMSLSDDSSTYPVLLALILCILKEAKSKIAISAPVQRPNMSKDEKSAVTKSKKRKKNQNEKAALDKALPDSQSLRHFH